MNDLNDKIKAEGDEFEFVAFGLDCYMRRHPSVGHWCGYVKIPKGSRLEGAKTYYYTDSELGLSDFEEAINNLDVHGGVTYSGRRRNDGSLYWGFDCGHLGDLSPFMDGLAFEGDTYRDKEYVIEECKKLALQIKEITETYSHAL